MSFSQAKQCFSCLCHASEILQQNPLSSHGKSWFAITSDHKQQADSVRPLYINSAHHPKLYTEVNVLRAYWAIFFFTIDRPRV